MTSADIAPLLLYGVLVAVTALGGIFGPPIVLLVAAGLAILWVVMLFGHRQARSR